MTADKAGKTATAASIRTVVVADSNLVPLRAEFEAALPAGVAVNWPDAGDAGAVEAALADADVLVSAVCSARMAAVAPRLRLVHAAGAGTEKIDIGSLAPGTVVAHTFHHEDSMAEYVLSSAILLRRGFLRQHRALRHGEWDSPAYDPRSPWVDSLATATVGFVGFGHIGARCWELFRAFGARGVAVTRRGDVDAAARRLAWSGTVDDLGTLLETSDIVVVSAPLTEATAGLIGAAELSRMRPDAVLINVGRGPVVDEDALYRALSERAIGAAALDVWYRYPPGGHTGAPGHHPFEKLDNVLMTPHSSGLTRETFARRAADIAANIGRLAAGEELRDVVAVAR
ncbi:2-hydroxyacid dehydrogenase [Streptomyces scopuliridis]|uniref:2-hydroxyacid dehydrogenase n=1 Tax=Streptomyces scopuliridis TaxID=452529 RepID=A0ACD4ZU47_9ACTN|nr:2-hydroxyacid dehydrogenase [Streptomyces scopuliridis]WSC01479.1 2-hydroxyacid dehydrogenase [Streptomyces scopuliridis]WSC04984.1 2-hydroxyacid dehydrogenase [Streptomyces scopuliridis]